MHHPKRYEPLSPCCLLSSSLFFSQESNNQHKCTDRSTNAFLFIPAVTGKRHPAIRNLQSISFKIVPDAKAIKIC